MALISLFFKRPQPTQILRTVGGAVVPLILDATIKETFTTPAEPTQHPIENGADATDHIILRPNGLSLSGVITETPFAGILDFIKASGATAGSIAGQALGPFGEAAGAVVGGLGTKTLANSIFGSTNRVLGAVSAEFQKLRDARQPVDIQTGLQLYRSYVMTNCTVTRDQKTGGSINVELEFKELILVTSQVGTVAIPKVKGALQSSNHGRQSKQALDAAQSGRSSSLLKQLAGQG